MMVFLPSSLTLGVKSPKPLKKQKVLLWEGGRMLKGLGDATGKLIGSVKSGIEIAVEAGKNSLMSHGGASDIILVRFSRLKFGIIGMRYTRTFPSMIGPTVSMVCA